MNENSSEVNELIKDTEKRYGKKLYSPIDFEEFVERLNASGQYNLSVSTMNTFACKVKHGSYLYL